MTDPFVDLPPPGLPRGFRQSTRRLVLSSPNGARIVLDADQAKIQMFGINGLLLAELDAAQEFFGDSLFVQKIYDFNSTLRSQWSGLQLFIAGDDGRIEIKAGSSGVDSSMPQLTVTPDSATADGRVKAQPETDNGASLTIESPAFSTHDQSSVVLFAENDSDPSHVDLTAGDFNIAADVAVTGDVVISGDLQVTGNDLNGSGAGTFQLLAAQPVVHIGSNSAFNQLFIGNTSNATDIQKDSRSLGFNIEGVTDNAIADTDTSSTFNSIAGTATATFVKERVNTRVSASQATTWFTTVANNTTEFGLNFNNGAGTNVTVTMSREQKTPANSRSGSTVGFAVIAAATLPQGTYTVTLMWRRVAGTGTNSVDSNDSASFMVREEIQA